MHHNIITVLFVWDSVLHTAGSAGFFTPILIKHERRYNTNFMHISSHAKSILSLLWSKKHMLLVDSHGLEYVLHHF